VDSVPGSEPGVPGSIPRVGGALSFATPLSVLDHEVK